MDIILFDHFIYTLATPILKPGDCDDLVCLDLVSLYLIFIYSAEKQMNDTQPFIKGNPGIFFWYIQASL